jgi:hypothetical protein
MLVTPVNMFFFTARRKSHSSSIGTHDAMRPSKEGMMNILLVVSILMTIFALLFGMFLTMKRWRALSRQRTMRRLRWRNRGSKIPGITPLTLRASRSPQALYPPTVTVLPTAIASPSCPKDEGQAVAQQRKEAAFQTTVYALPLATALVLSQCPRCGQQVTTQDLFCGFCGCRLHRTTRLHD